VSELKIKVGDKEYDIPVLNMGQMKAFNKRIAELTDDNMLSVEGVDNAIDIFYALLNDTYPELTKKVLEKMPAYQGGAAFAVKLWSEFFNPPLDSKPKEENL